MYQFYYADKKKDTARINCKDNVRNHYQITAVRPTMWEEHCLECAAPTCFESCAHYKARSDGRCMRFDNGLSVFKDAAACCGQGTHVKFRKWANMMTIIFPAMLEETEYLKLFDKNQGLGKKLEKMTKSKLPQSIRWNGIRTLEYMRRKELRGLTGLDNQPDAFIFHGYSYGSEAFRLIMEVYDDHTPVYKTALNIEPGENMHILSQKQLSSECWKEGNLVKIYPENDMEAELDILWCDFVKGKSLSEEKPAEKVKCLVWDLDNTLWDGVLIETEDANDITLRPGVMETIKQLDERGIIQSIASKNNYEEAWSVVEALGIGEYFIYPQIHWNAKSESMKAIADALNIGIDSLALIDDTPFEREQVMSVCSSVRCYDVTELDNLLNYPEFQVVVTADSRNRRAMYQAEVQRRELLNDDGEDLLSFLRKCNLRMTILEPTTEEEKIRCFELITRTNQLNMTGKKYSLEEFEDIYNKEDHINFAFSCADNFGEYGIVGFGQYKVEEKTLVFTEFAMSCRVAGKYVECALFGCLLEREKCSKGFFAIQKTKKNILLRNTLEDVGFNKETDSSTDVEYSFTEHLKNCDVVSCQQ